MAPAALAAPIASISTSSAGRVTGRISTPALSLHSGRISAAAIGGGLRSRKASPMGASATRFLRSSFVSSSSTSSASASPAALSAAVSASLTFTSASSFAGNLGLSSISTSSAGRVTSSAATGLRSARMASSPVAQPGGETVVFRSVLRQRRRPVLRSSSSDETKSTTEDKTPFGYTRKDVLLIGVGVTLLGYGLKYGLELVGVDPLQAGNAVQLIIVLGMTVGWISTYIFRVANKDMTYAQQLRDYEKQVMEKRLESLTEAELQVLLEQVEEEKQRLTPVRDQGITFTRKTEDQTNAS